MGHSDGHLLITWLRKTALVGLRLRRLKSKCPPGNHPGFVTERSIEVYLRTILLQISSNFGRGTERKKKLRLRGWNSCRIRVPSCEFSARMLPVLPEVSPGSSSVHLETCTGSVIHTLPRLSFVINHSTSRSSSLNSEPLLQTGRPRNRVSIPGSKNYQVSYSVGNWCSFPGIKKAEA